MTMRRVLAALLTVSLLSGPFAGIASADLFVVKGAYTATLRGPIIGGAYVQDTSLVDETTGTRVGVTAAKALKVTGGGAVLGESIAVRCVNESATAFESCAGQGGGGGGGGGTEFNEDAPHVSGALGTLSLGVRRDTATTTAEADGDYVPFIFDAFGRLHTASVQAGNWTVTANIGTTGGLATDATLTGGAARMIVRGGAKGATPAADVTASSVDANISALDVFIRGGAGGAGGVAQTDESAFTEGVTSTTPIAGVFNDSIGSDPTEDQAAAVRITAKRGMHMNPRNAAGVEIGTAAAPFRVDTTDTTPQTVRQTTAANLKAQVQGEAASGATKAGNPLQIGGVFNTTQPTVTDGQVVEAQMTARGAQIVATGVEPFDVTGTVTVDQGSAAGGASAWPIAVTNTADTVVKPGDAANNAVRVHIVASAVGSDGTAMNDDAPFTPGSTLFTPAGGIYRSARDLVDDNDGGAFAMTQRRAIIAALEDMAGNAVTTGAAGSTRPIHVAAVDASGNHIAPSTVDGSGNAIVVGSIAHGSANSGAPVSVGGVATTALSAQTLVSNGQRTNASFTPDGKLLVSLNGQKGDFVKGSATATGTSNTSVVAAQGAGVSFCLTDWFVSNTSASDTTFKLVNDVGGGNTAVTAAISAPAGSGNNKTLGTPICFGANQAAGFVAQAGVTTLEVTFNGYKTKE